MPSAKHFFTDEQKEQIKTAIQEAERQTNGEIRVHIEAKCPGDPMERAAHWFDKLEMAQTENATGVLFYLAIKSKQFSVIGDEGIHAKVGEDFWQSLRDEMQQHFREGQFTEGLVAAIAEAGTRLKKHFPKTEDNQNELSDDISFRNE